MKHVSVLIKPASSSCNMRCRYCFYCDVSALREIPSYGLMTEEDTERILDQVYLDLEDGDHLALAFQGGEPTLAGLSYFERLTAYAGRQPKKVRLAYSIQTNGLLLDDRWAAFLKKHGFLVGLSMDGPAAMHDANRLDIIGQGTHERVKKARHLLDSYRIPYNILMVLTRSMAEHPDDVMDDLLKKEIGYVQFIPCLPGLQGGKDQDDQEEDAHALTPDLFASFYDRVAARWLEELREGRYLHIQLFDALLDLLATGHEGICGLKGHCHLQNVVEADGGVYPCDFYVLDRYRMGSLTTERLSVLREGKAAISFLKERNDRAALCMTCPYDRICGGGCRRMKEAMYLDRDEGSCGYRSFLDAHYQTFRRIAQQLV